MSLVVEASDLPPSASSAANLSHKACMEQAREMEKHGGGGGGGGGYGGYGRNNQVEGPSAAELEEEVAGIQRSILRIKVRGWRIVAVIRIAVREVQKCMRVASRTCSWRQCPPDLQILCPCFYLFL